MYTFFTFVTLPDTQYNIGIVCVTYMSDCKTYGYLLPCTTAKQALLCKQVVMGVVVREPSTQICLESL